MAEKPIQNCEVRFRFQCPKQWEALQETGEAGVRSCSQCQKQVYLCQSRKEVTQHARQGHCIAVPRWVTSPQDFPDDPERLQALAREYGMSTIDLRGRELDPHLFLFLPRELARKYPAVPVSRTGTLLTVAISDPTNISTLDELRFLTNNQVELVLASPRDIEEALARAGSDDPGDVTMGEPLVDDNS